MIGEQNWQLQNVAAQNTRYKMLRLLKFLITGDFHLHKWETTEEHHAKLYVNEHDRNVGLPHGGLLTYVYKCSVCGLRKMQQFRT